jgi:hypothetical protein
MVIKLTDNQLIVLSKAAAREDGAAVLPLTMNKAAAVKVGSGLIGGRRTASRIQAGPRCQAAVEATGRDARRPGRSNRLAAPYDAGGPDGSSQARFCGRADPE